MVFFNYRGTNLQCNFLHSGIVAEIRKVVAYIIVAFLNPMPPSEPTPVQEPSQVAPNAETDSLPWARERVGFEVGTAGP